MTPPTSSLVQVGVDTDGQISLLDIVPDAIVAADQDGRILLCNHQAATIFGSSIEELVGMPVEALIPSDRRERHRSLRTEFGRHPVARPMHSISAVEAVRLDDGSRFPVRVSLSPALVRGELHVIATIRDVSEEPPRALAMHIMRDAPRYLADSSIDLVAVLDEHAVCTWISLSIGRLTGLAPEAVLGRDLDSVIHSGDVSAWSEVLEQARAARPTVTRDLRMCDPDAPDRCRWLEAMVTSRVGPEGRLAGFVVGFRDVHALVLADQARALSEHRYRILAQNSTDVVVEIDGSHTVTWASPSVANAIGLAPGEVEGMPVSELAIWEDRRDFALRVGAAMADGQVTSWQCRIRTGPDDWRWMSARCAPTDEGGVQEEKDPIAVVGLSDVHDLVIARESTARSERMFRLAMDGAPQGMAVVGLHHYFLEANDSLARTIDRPIDWLLKHTLADVMHPSDLEADLALRDELLMGRRGTMCAQRRLIAGDGKTIRVTHSTGLLRDEAGMPLFFVEQFQYVGDTEAATQE